MAYVNGESIVLQSLGYNTNQLPIMDVFSDHDTKFTIQFVLRILEEVPKIIDSNGKVNIWKRVLEFYITHSLYGLIATKWNMANNFNMINKPPSQANYWLKLQM